MRNNIVHIGADELTYEIREIIGFAEKIKKMGADIIWRSEEHTSELQSH